mmetsp:Transcript_144310/g.359731  ORF Transcript_144310/g.359731 Transcript_144310/m.359731 type:complete len:375 (+) Transcript_144310:80-1204(+)
MAPLSCEELSGGTADGGLQGAQKLGRRALTQRPPGASETSQQLIAKLREARERSELLRADAARLSESLAASAGRIPTSLKSSDPDEGEQKASSSTKPAAAAAAVAQKRPQPQCELRLGSRAAAVVLASAARRWVRIRLGTLDVRASNGGGGLALLETSGLRVSLQFGAEAPARWIPGGPATRNRQSLKYSRLVSGDGQYSTRACCEFDEEIDLPWSLELQQRSQPIQVAADIWLEKRTVAEKLDSLLDRVGLGSDLPECDRTWLGRAVCLLPPEGEDTVPQPWPVITDVNSNGPLPKTLTVGVEWILDEGSPAGAADGEEQEELAVACRPSGLPVGDADAVSIDRADGQCTGSGCMRAPLMCGLWSRPVLCCYG